MEDQDGRYQICGPNAFNRYGFDEQVPTRVYAYNNRLSRERTIGSVALTLIKVTDNRLRQQVDPQLKPVLRESDFQEFDLERAFQIVAEMAKSSVD
jgi:hypothetical protein